MASLSQSNGAAERRAGSSPRPKGRENAKDTLCRNVTIYGHCRYEDKGCAFSHEPMKSQAQQAQAESMKKRFNVDSPSFTPTTLPANGSNGSPKPPGLSPRVASAAPFRPKNFTPAPSSVASSVTSSSSLKPYNPNAPDFLAPDVPELLSHNYNGLSTGDTSASFPLPIQYEQQYSDTSHIPTPSQPEPDLGGVYDSDTNGFAQNIYAPQVNQPLSHQPLQHHLYANLGPISAKIQPNHRPARESFLPEDLRQKLQRRSEAFLRNFGPPHSSSAFHSMTPLFENLKPNRHFPGYQSSVFKATDSRDGRTYCLRRIFPFKTDDPASEEKFRMVRSNWRRVRNSNVVSFHEVYTDTEAFEEPSLIIVSDYHPESLTLQQHHANFYNSSASRRGHQYVPEKLLWKYVVQVSNALKAIHEQGLSARILAADKLLVTDQDRIKFNGCAVADIMDSSMQDSVELHRKDLRDLGGLIVSLGAGHTKTRPLEHFERSYNSPLRDAIDWLLHSGEDSITTFLSTIGPATMDCFNTVQSDDELLQLYLNRELENSRLVRLLLKLGTVNERPEYAKDPMWDDYGPRGKLKLFRDYVFHQVDAQGRPVLDMGHMLACLNKLDSGLDEKIRLETRDGNFFLLVSFKEMKQLIEGAFQDVSRRSRA